jgi:pimeloyl-ACP methyl ester carboxylesterase
MSAFVLVHGSTQNKSCWERVGCILAARGHIVVTPDLPKRALDWGLREYASEIAQSIPTADTVVVAHSFSGVFLPLVAQMRDCGLVVFLAAVIPEPGKSVRDQFAEDAAMFSPGWIGVGARWFANPPQQKQLAENFLFHDCDDETKSWALGTIESFDTRHLVDQPIRLEAWPALRAASIVASEDRTLSPEWSRKMSRAVLGAEAIEIEAGHCPHCSQPRTIANILEQLAMQRTT